MIEKELEKIESAKFVVLGAVDAAKSTFCGVMTKGILDDGNGYARSLVTKFKHEQESGRTSTHMPHYLVKGNEITTLVDLCGHEKYFKTTMFGVMGLFADYGIVLVGSNMGINEMTIEHIGLLIANRIPFITILTKIDLCPANILFAVKKDLERIAKRNKKEIIYFEENEKEIDGSYLKEGHRIIVNAFQERRINFMPVIMTSNKTGHNTNFIRELLMSIKSKAYLEKMNGCMIENKKTASYPSIMYIDNTFSVRGIGIVLSGTLKYGSIYLGQKLYVGPVNNAYISVTAKSIHNCISEEVPMLRENESGSIGIRIDGKNVFSREMFSKGQIVTPDYDFAMRNTCFSFMADVVIFNHPTTIRNGYQSMVHLNSIRQTANFKIDGEKILRTNSREKIGIKFIHRAEFILPNTIFMFRDGKTKGMGKVRTTVPFTEDSLDPTTPKRRGRHSRFEKKRTRSENQRNLPKKIN